MSVMRSQAGLAGGVELSRTNSISTALGGAVALAAALGIGRFVFTPILPPMAEALGLSNSAAGLIASANFLGYLIGALVVAMPILPGSRRLWLLGALGASAVTTGGMGLTQTLMPFLALRFVGGAASAFVLILISALVLERLAEAGRTGLSSLCFAGVGIGIAISATLVAAILQTGGSWQSLWLASGALSAVAAFAVAALLQNRAMPPHPANGPVGQATGRGLIHLIAAYGLFGFGYVITATFLVAIVRSTPTIRSLEPVIWVLFGVAAAPSVAFWMWIARPLGIPRTFALACLIQAAGVVASVAWPSELGAFLAAMLVGGTFMGLTALGLVRARALATSDPRHALAYMTSAFGLGQIIGPVFAGALSDRFGSFTVPSMTAAIALIMAAVLSHRSEHLGPRL